MKLLEEQWVDSCRKYGMVDGFGNVRKMGGGRKKMELVERNAMQSDGFQNWPRSWQDDNRTYSMAKILALLVVLLNSTPNPFVCFASVYPVEQ